MMSIIRPKRMTAYQVRPATLDDVDSLVDQRVGMFTDMGQMTHPDATASAFRSWLADTMPAGVYRAWVAETGDEAPAQDVPSGTTERQGARSPTVVAGGGITVLPWPPGPQSLTGRIAFVYNVYTAPAHRGRGIGRLVMEAIHTWCREHGYRLPAAERELGGSALVHVDGVPRGRGADARNPAGALAGTRRTGETARFSIGSRFPEPVGATDRARPRAFACDATARPPTRERRATR